MELPPNARFCPQCGVQQAEQASRTPATSLLTRGLAHDGERRQLTVMFCDVVGSTRLSTEIDPEDLREVLRAFQTEAATVIEAAGGLIARYMGDGILAYFGYPTALEDAPRRAALAGLEILRRIDGLNHGELRAYDVSLALRIGLHTGIVIVGQMGSGRTREEHSIVGETPNIAAFVESCAPPNTVVVSAVTAGLIKPGFRMKTLGQHSGKGLETPIELFHILGQDAAAERQRFTPSSSVIGRDRELATLQAAWKWTCETGKMSIITLTGEPGIGKSGLTAQFLRDADIPRQRLVRLHGVHEERDSAFVAVLRLVTNWLASEPTDDYDLVAHRVRDWFAENGVVDTAPVNAILRLWRPDRFPQSEPAGTDEAVRDGVFAAFARFIAARAKPLAIVLEDAHWVDPSTIELIESVLVSQRDAPIFFLAVSRPGPASRGRRGGPTISR
ncbi:adenylate/guanylate cyclase domain-containing protein [Breoghania sp. L-A4]|uniref:adenylate/guanylate cyclase domain-containing protein n=1 Tax=Breoghania sp. L-A4 TaxID=2304600 RepID=UPI0020C003BD|nr:adenylate/guanylate cyclase domain-containing protein [Breoghania sp. L-A4]